MNESLEAVKSLQKLNEARAAFDLRIYELRIDELTEELEKARNEITALKAIIREYQTDSEPLEEEE